MAVKVRKRDVNGHYDGEATYPNGAFVSVEGGVLSVRKRSETRSAPGQTIAVYQEGFWLSADVVED